METFRKINNIQLYFACNDSKILKFARSGSEAKTKSISSAHCSVADLLTLLLQTCSLFALMAAVEETNESHAVGFLKEYK